MTFRQGLSAFGRGISRHLPDILAAIGVAGIGATAYLSGKSALKIDAILKETSEETLSKRTSIQILKAAAPAIGAGIASAACMIASARISGVRIKALNGAYISLQNNFRDYKLAAAGVAGSKVQEVIRDASKEKNITFDGALGKNEDGELLYIFYDEYSRRQFPSTLTDVMEAEYQLNRLFVKRGWATLNEFYRYLDIPGWESGDMLGWDICAGSEFYGYEWVDFVNTKHITENGDIWYSIEMPFEPTIDGYDFDQDYVELDEVNS